MTAISSSPRNTTSRVWLRIAGMSEATKNSSLPRPIDDRRAVADRDDLFRILDRHQDEREHAAHERQRAPHGVLEAVAVHLALDQVRDDFGVGFGLELVSLRLQLVLQLEVVLDDAVMDDDDAAGAVAVRMRVFLGGPPVRRPARVADAVQAVDRLRADGVLEVDELSGRSAQRDALGADDAPRPPSRSRGIPSAAGRPAAPERPASIRCIR